MKGKRQFKKLRISLTDNCNLACTYCVEDESGHQTKLKEGAKPLALKQFVQLIKELHTKLQLDSVRLTGGEPLLFPDILPLILEIKGMGIHNIGLTTNGYYLKHLAGKLKHAGLSSINVSLDAIEEEVFEKMTRKPLLKTTIQGIEKAHRYGIKLKINAVILKGRNEDQILPLLKYGLKKGIPVRFLELMRMGYLHYKYNQYFFPEKDILDQISSQFNCDAQPRVESSTSNYWKIEGHDYSFGIIANESTPFCADCNRLRLDSYGNIYGCISSSIGIPILNSSLDKSKLEMDLKRAMKQKQPVRFVGSELSMQFLGG